MAADVISPATLSTNLDTELENARATLRGVEDNIKRVFGKDASELSTFQRPRRNLPLGRSFHEMEDTDYGGPGRGGPMFRSRDRDSLRRKDNDNFGREEEPMDKRRKFDDFSVTVNRSAPIVLTSRLLKPKYDEEEEHYGNGDYNGSGPRGREPQRLQSRIVSSIKEKSREEALAEQRQDRSGRDRNKRMFGALLGTLHRFKQDETKLKEKEEKRAQIEAKLEEQAQQEKESVKKEKQQLIRDRKMKLTEIKRLEIKKRRLEELDQWEVKTKYLRNFIRTEAKPHIFYLPKQMNPITECRLEASKQIVEEMIVNKRKLVMGELDSYEERSKRYWDSKLDGQDMRKVKADPFDENMEDELKALMKEENLQDESGISDEKDRRKSDIVVISMKDEKSTEMENIEAQEPIRDSPGSEPMIKEEPERKEQVRGQDKGQNREEHESSPSDDEGQQDDAN